MDSEELDVLKEDMCAHFLHTILIIILKAQTRNIHLQNKSFLKLKPFTVKAAVFRFHFKLPEKPQQGQTWTALTGVA